MALDSPGEQAVVTGGAWGVGIVTARAPAGAGAAVTLMPAPGQGITPTHRQLRAAASRHASRPSNVCSTSSALKQKKRADTASAPASAYSATMSGVSWWK